MCLVDKLNDKKVLFCENEFNEYIALYSLYPVYLYGNESTNQVQFLRSCAFYKL